MKHMYSDQLVAYLFDEIDPETKQSIEKELTTNKKLQNELEELKSALELVKSDTPLSPNPKLIENILEESGESEPIPAD